MVRLGMNTALQYRDLFHALSWSPLKLRVLIRHTEEIPWLSSSTVGICRSCGMVIMYPMELRGTNPRVWAERTVIRKPWRTRRMRRRESLLKNDRADFLLFSGSEMEMVREVGNLRY